MNRLKKLSSRLLLVALVLTLMSSPLVAGGGGAQSGAGDPLFIFNGTGRAHGVGLCMDGVYYRALEGHSYRTMISHYYTGIQFGRTDDNQPIRVKCRDGQIRVYSLREYLYRLQEEPETYPSEGLKVLYVAARTYTLSCIARGKHADEGYDICPSGGCCQAFDENKDLSKYPNNCAAVNATAGEVILYDGKIITAAYCGSCGGHSENNEDVWGGTPLPYLRGKPDTYCQASSRYAWTVSMRKSELEARLNAHADSRIGYLYSMDLSDRTPGGRVRTATLIGSERTVSVSGGTLSTRLGMQSRLFDLVPNNFDEYILVLNPNPETTVATFTFMQPDGSTYNQIVEIAGHSRFTLKVNDYIQFQEVSTRIISEFPIIAERAMYFNFQGRYGGSDCSGATLPGDRWYFAEGYTGGGFDTFILVENPDPEAAEMKFTFMVPGGQNIETEAVAQPFSRMTVHVDTIPGLEDTEVSTMVESTNGVGVVTDRAMYFDYFGLNGGTSESGIDAPASEWYLAEGYTGGRFDTYVLMQNPGDEPATVEVTFMREDGTNIERTYQLLPRSRQTIVTDEIEGLEDASFSTRLVSSDGTGMIAERSMYFDYNGLAGGHDGTGSTAPATQWHFAEGYTGDMFDTWILLQNPDDRPAEVEVTFTKPDGSKTTKAYTLKANSRLTIPVDAVEGLGSAEVSTTVRSTNDVGVIAERAMYFNYRQGFGERGGGHNTAGVTSPSTQWYFAEGYTGY